MAEETDETEETIRAEYEDRLWEALGRAVPRPIGPATEADMSAPYRRLMEELGLKGWGVSLVFGPTGTNTRGMHFFRAPKAQEVR